MRKALVTGGAGFIGSHAVACLLSHGWRVRVLDDLSSGSRENLDTVSRLHREGGASGADCTVMELFEGDIRDAALCRAACAGIDSVFHMAAIASVARSVAEPDATQPVNIGGTLNMLMAARDAGVRRFVFSSSAAVYGNAEVSPIGENQPILPQSPYATEKACGEMYCRNFWDLYRLETVVLRYFNVFGPRQSATSGYAAVIPNFIKAITNGTDPVVYGDGLQTRDFVYVENVASANLRAALAPGIAGRTFNIGTGHGISLLDMLSEIERATGAEASPEFQAAHQGDIRHSCADIALASEALGYRPAVPYAEGLRRTLVAASATELPGRNVRPGENRAVAPGLREALVAG